MKTRLSDGSSQVVAVSIQSTLKCYDQVEVTSSHLTGSGGDDARVLVILGHAHAALVRMRGKILDHAGRTLEQFVERSDSRDLLIIAVRARVIIGPGDRFVFFII